MKLSDIRQGKHGDCFILASIISILYSYGESYINTMIDTKEKNKYILNYYDYLEQQIIKKELEFIFDSSHILSPKNKLWVQLIEYGYILAFHNNEHELIIKNGGIAKNVLFHLTGIEYTVLINRIFDNKTEFHKELCEHSIINDSWDYKFINLIDKISKYSISKWLYKIWNYLLQNIAIKDLKPNIIYDLTKPCVIGTINNDIMIPGIIAQHSYSILSISIDDYQHKYLHIFNPQYNTKSRKTNYNNDIDRFDSIVSIDRYSKWNLLELCLFVSDITLPKIIKY